MRNFCPPRSSSAARSVTLPFDGYYPDPEDSESALLKNSGVSSSPCFASVVVFIASTVLRRSTFGVCVL